MSTIVCNIVKLENACQLSYVIL